MKIERVNAEIQKELMQLIQYEVKDPRVRECKMLSIMRVDTTGDLKYAKVYVSIMDSTNPKEVISALQSCAGFLRKSLFERLKVRAVPELTFVLDESIEYGMKIEKILKQINVTPATDEDGE